MGFTSVTWLLAGIALLLSFVADKVKTVQAVKTAIRSLFRILPNMLGVIGVIGLLLTVIPSEAIASLSGKTSWWGTLVLAVIGAITLIPAFVAFPLAASLLRSGARVVPISAFITTLTMVGVVTAPLEIQFFGRRYTIARNLLSFVFALVIAVLMGVFV